MKIFVYGATGQIGSGVVERLLGAGHEVWAATRNPEKQERRENLTWVQVDSARPGSGFEALTEVERAFLMSPPGQADQNEVLGPWVQEAAKAGLQKVVMMTALGLDQAPPEVPFRKLELALINSGLPYNIIRPNWFMQNFNTFWIEGILRDKTIYFPGGEAKTSFIDSRDIVESAFILLTGDEHTGKEFALTGSEALTHDEVAALIGKSTGVDIRYIDVGPEDFRASLVRAGLPEDYADLLVSLAANLAAGYNAGVSGAVKDITGKDPVLFGEYATAYKDAWLQASVS